MSLPSPTVQGEHSYLAKRGLQQGKPIPKTMQDPMPTGLWKIKNLHYVYVVEFATEHVVPLLILGEA